MRRVLGILAMVYLLALLTSCQELPIPNTAEDAPDQKVESNPTQKAAPLASSAPNEQGVDAEKLKAAYRQADTLRPLWSLLVLRNDVVVGEDYFHGAERDTAYNIKSVSKSIISARSALLFGKVTSRVLTSRLLICFLSISNRL